MSSVSRLFAHELRAVFVGGDEVVTNLTDEGKEKFIDACYDSGMTGVYELQTSEAVVLLNLANVNHAEIKKVDQPFEAPDNE